MQNRISIVSDASVLLGSLPIQSFEEDTVEAHAARVCYDNTYEQLLSYRPWTFARDRLKLQRLDKESTYDFKYVYRVPSEVLSVISLEGNGYDRYKLVRRREIHTDCDKCLVNAIVKVEEDVLPGDFTLAFKYLLASNMCPIITDNDAQAERFYAQGSRYLTIAADADAVQQPLTYKTVSPLLAYHV